MKPIKHTVQGAWSALSVTALSVLCAALLAACGGGDSDSDSVVPLVRPAASEAGASATSVRLEGCVVDEYFIPRTGTTVRVVSGDGRLIGHAISDRQGLFTLQVPAHQAVAVSIERVGGESLVVPTGRSDLSVGACLLDPHA
jgi:hypothetical protein